MNKERISDEKGENELNDEGFYKPTKSTLRAAPSSKTYRLPHVTLAARMEKEILGLWTSKNAALFQYPVENVKGYSEKIKNPMCLLDIRNKNGECVVSYISVLCPFALIPYCYTFLKYGCIS